MNTNDSQLSLLKKYGFNFIVIACLVILAVLRYTSVIDYKLEVILAGILFIIWFVYGFKLAPQAGRSFSKKSLYICILLEIISIISNLL